MLKYWLLYEPEVGFEDSETVSDPLPDLLTTDGDGEVLTLVRFHALLALSNEPICIAQKLILWI